MKILFCSLWFPYPADNGSKIRIFNLLRELSKSHQVSLVSFAESGEATVENQQALLNFCARIEVVPRPVFQQNSLRALAGFFSTRPRSVVDTYSLEMYNMVKQIDRDQSFDLIIASQLGMAPYAVALPSSKKILEEIELTTLFEKFSQQRHLLRRNRARLMWWKASRYVARLLTEFDGCTVVSEQEKIRVQEISPNDQSIAVIPNGVDVAKHLGDFGPVERDTLIYSGALTFDANFDAMDFFLSEVFPLIQRQRPHVKLFITGNVCGVPIDQLPANEGVIFTGYLDDIRLKIAQSWLSVVPLRVGGGTRLKILESLALGTPVVATSKGAEGLDLMPERELLIADTPTDFAAEVLRLLNDPALRTELSQKGREAVASRYDWPIIGHHLNEFFEAVVSSPKRSSVLARKM